MNDKHKKKKIFTISIYCRKCSTFLYKYNKEGPGFLVKCYISNIFRDRTRNDLKCPNCGQTFARLGTVHNRSVHKIIRGKIFTRGHCKK